MNNYTKSLFGFPVIFSESLDDDFIVLFKDMSNWAVLKNIKKEEEKMKITPKVDCKSCHGRGLVSGDWVDYGSTKAQLPDEYCDCVIEQLPEDYSGDITLVLE